MASHFCSHDSTADIMCASIGHVYHGNLADNTSLRYLECSTAGMTAGNIREALKAMVGELHKLFSTIRSYQVEQIKLGPRLPLNARLQISQEELANLLGKSELKDLHTVLNRPFFDSLKTVEFALPGVGRRRRNGVRDSEEARLSMRELAPVVRAVLAPWHDRGVLRLDARIVFGPFELETLHDL